MNTPGFNRRKFLQLGSTIAVASAVTPIAYGASLFKDDALEFSKENESLRLFSNENPYGPSPKVLDTITKHTNRVNRYASFHTYDTNHLKKMIAERNNIKEDQVILGHGSFEILCMLTRTFGKEQNSIIVPATTFNVTAAFADRIFDHKVKRMLLNQAMNIDLEATKKAVTKDTKLVYICNPNNPTGKALPAAELISFCKEVASSTCTVAIDEAYIELMNPSDTPDTIKLLRENHNVLIIRTFSKAYGLAGLRVGYAMGSAETIALLNHEHYNFSGLIANPGVVAAITALEDTSYVDEYRKKNSEVRTYVEKSLDTRSIKYVNSSTNFILMDVKDAKRFRSELKPFGFAIIPGGGKHYPTWARISIGRLEEMNSFLKVLDGMNWLKA
ncbi:aminotransferase class I/II-fold pyridoxal phosphate-dependent enzyme [Aquimarina sp. BL5]|uniref:pyridoxal phosphate-dependent aminotransferase n=1 Tax=Aquimarina sp. BL5 TaxID=1714860 RepID=UPI000E4B60E9|nr:histidinol-phosphate transaminase [Aquimarina sp. BL5]AXT49454.1 aminotransferase class I/II-fold pyridoxal phosphate-dependent enzyme [Aquimarina sp. BL5]RKM92971.1 aminotransferase class I/II-fold pyridoxal phosphate-dependent enzyme [Aquimarina sp. BL5]